MIFLGARIGRPRPAGGPGLRRRCLLVWVLCLGTACWPVAQNEAAQSQRSGVPTASQVIAYLNQTLNWHREIAVQEQVTSDVGDTLFLSDSKELDRQIVGKSFDFARAAAALLANSNANAAPSGAQPRNRYQALQQAAAAADVEVRKTQAEVTSLRRESANAAGRKRAAVRAQLEEVQSELGLAQTRSQILRNMMQFASSSGASADGANLQAQIEELQRSVPETAPVNPQKSSASTATTAGAAAEAAAAATENRRISPSGILNILTDLFGLRRKIRSLDQVIASTDALSQASRQLRSPMASALTAATQQGSQLAQQADTANAAQLQNLKQQLDALTGQFKQIAGVVLPLGEQSILLDSYKTNLVRWRDAVRSLYSLELKQLLIRGTVFGIVVAIILGLAEVWRRAIFRYVHDVRRRYQFLLLRRILLWFVIAITAAFALASEVRSIATFAGLITAGVAVALQNVILAIAGYFFLIGKYGVRVGDRVQISGVSGDVVDIGLLRLHLMEVGGAGSDRHPTGRVVVFSNAVVFQPTASFFKQIPGTSFVWHEVSLILAPESDYHLAEKRIVGAIEKVYGEYKNRIEQQHHTMERVLNVTVPVPRPRSRLQLTQNGLEVVIRYPVEMDNAAEIDDQITRELLRALEQPPKLRLVGSGTPNIQPVPAPDGGGPAVQRT